MGFNLFEVVYTCVRDRLANSSDVVLRVWVKATPLLPTVRLSWPCLTQHLFLLAAC